MLDCLWGLLDGINDAGLAVSLTFGGRPQVGEGFGIPLVIRYVLQTCGTTEEAMRALRRIPVHMSYNVTAMDRDGQRATVYLAPDRPAHVTSLAVATNHQGTVEWAPYAAAIRTVERHERLTELVTAGTDVPGVVAAACSLRCTRPGSARASAPFTPPSTGRPKALPATTGRSTSGSTRCGISEPTAWMSGLAPRDLTQDSRYQDRQLGPFGAKGPHDPEPGSAPSQVRTGYCTFTPDWAPVISGLGERTSGA